MIYILVYTCCFFCLLFSNRPVDDLERLQSNTSAKTRALENEVQSLQQEAEKLEREIILKRKTLEMLPSAVDNIGEDLVDLIIALFE